MSVKPTNKFKPLSEIDTAICQRVGSLRRAQKLNQEDFAKSLSITRAQLANIESARVPLKFLDGVQMCQAYDANAFWLASGFGLMKPSVPLNLTELAGSITERTLFSDAFKQVARLREPVFVELAKSVFGFPGPYPPVTVAQKQTLFAYLLLQSPSELQTFLYDIASAALSAKSRGLTYDAKALPSPHSMTGLEHLIDRVKSAAALPGKKADLARFLDVRPQRVREWLSGEKHPGGDTTLRLLEWVTIEEAKTKTPASADNTRKGEQTRKGNHHESKTGPSRKR